LWFLQTQSVPSLAERIPNSAIGTGGVVAANARERLFPETQNLRMGAINGYRLNAGIRLTPEAAIDGNFFWLENKTISDTFAESGAAGTSGLARVYTQAGTNSTIHLDTALPGQYGGSIALNAASQFWGYDGNLRWDTYRLFSDRTEALLGYRYFELEESLSIVDRSNFNNGSTSIVEDHFATRNKFYGGQIGAHSRFYGPKWSLDFIGKFAIGGVRQSVDIAGSNSFILANGTVNREEAGLFARSPNIGSFSRNKFAVAAESTVMLGYNVTDNIRLQVGYNSIWMSSVVRAGEMINPTVNDSRVRFVANPAASNADEPAFRWNRASDFYAQGLIVGATIGY
jgi:hypothetical protein